MSKELKSRIDSLSHAAHEMLRYIEQGIGVYKVSPPTLISKWQKVISPDINWKCFYEKRYVKVMSKLKKKNPELYYEILDELDREA